MVRTSLGSLKWLKTQYQTWKNNWNWKALIPRVLKIQCTIICIRDVRIILSHIKLCPYIKCCYHAMDSQQPSYNDEKCGKNKVWYFYEGISMTIFSKSAWRQWLSYQKKEKEGGRTFHKVSNKRLQSWDCLFKLTTDLLSILFKLHKKNSLCHCWNSLLAVQLDWVRALMRPNKNTTTKKWCSKTHGNLFA